MSTRSENASSPEGLLIWRLHKVAKAFFLLGHADVIPAAHIDGRVLDRPLLGLGAWLTCPILGLALSATCEEELGEVLEGLAHLPSESLGELSVASLFGLVRYCRVLGSPEKL